MSDSVSIQMRRMLSIGRPGELSEYHVMALREALWHDSSLAGRLWDEVLSDSSVLIEVNLKVLAALCDSAGTSKVHQQTALDLLLPGCSGGNGRAVSMALFLISKLGNAAHAATFDFVKKMWASLVDGGDVGALFFREMIRTKAFPKAALASIVKFTSLWELCKEARAEPVCTAIDELLALEFLDHPKDPLICTTRFQAATACNVVRLRSSSKTLFSWDTVVAHLESAVLDDALVGEVVPFVSHGTLEKLQHSASNSVARMVRVVLGVAVDRDAVIAVLSSTTALPPQVVDRARAIVSEEVVLSATNVVMLENVLRLFPGRFTQQLIAKCVGVSHHDKHLDRHVAILGDIVDEVSSVSDFFMALLGERSVDKEQLLVSFAKICVRHVAQGSMPPVATHLNRLVLLGIDQMLLVASGTPSRSARVSLLRSLSSSLDLYLSQPDTVELLFAAVADPSFDVVAESLKILCRLVELNPAFVKGRLELLVDQQTSIFIEAETLSASLVALFKLKCLIANDFIGVVQWAALEGLLFERAELSISHEYTAALLNVITVGIEKGLVKRRSLVQFFQHMSFRHESSLVRQAGLQGMLALVRVAGLALRVKLETAKLALAALSTSARWFDGEHQELVNLIGQIGVVQPPEEFTRDKNDGEVMPLQKLIDDLQPRWRWTPTFEQRADVTALYFLFKRLGTESASRRRIFAAVPRLLAIISSSQQDITSLLPTLLPPCFVLLRSPQWDRCHREILSVLKEAVLSMKKLPQLLVQMLGELSAFSRQERSNPDTVGELLDVIRCVSEHFPQETKQHCGWMAKFLVACLWQLSGNPKQLTRAISVLESVAYLLDRQLQVIVPVVLQLITTSKDPLLADLSTACLSFLLAVVQHQPIRNRAADIVSCAVAFAGSDGSSPRSRVAFELLEMIVQLCSKSLLGMLDEIDEVARASPHGGQLAFCIATFRETGAFPEKKVKVPKADPVADKAADSNASLKLKVGRRPNYHELMAEIARVAGVHPDELECTSSHDGDELVLYFSFKVSHAPIEVVEAALSALDIPVTRTPLQSTSASPLESHMQEVSSLQNDRDWFEWASDLAKYLIVISRHRGLRLLLPFVGPDTSFDRELLVFLLALHINGSGSRSRRKHIIDELQNLLLKNPPSLIQEVVFAVAEFFESERSTTAKVQPTSVAQTFRVKRESIDAKFGIIYDQEGKNIVVTRLVPGGVGEAAGVPVGAVLLNIDGYVPRTVNEIPPLIKSKQVITLALKVTTSAPTSDTPFFEMRLLLKFAEGAKMHEKAVFFAERLLEETVAGRGVQGSPSGMNMVGREEQILNFMGRLAAQLHSLDLTWEAQSLPTAVAHLAKLDISKFPQETLEFLRRWEELLQQQTALYDEKPSAELLCRIVRYLGCLGDVKNVLRYAKANWSALASPYRNALAESCSVAAFALQDWTFYNQLHASAALERLDPISLVAFEVASGNAADAKRDVSRRMTKLSATLNDAAEYGYDKAKKTILMIQHFRQLLDCMTFEPGRQREAEVLLKDWKRRLTTTVPRVEELIVALAIPSLVLPPMERTRFCEIFFESCHTNGWSRAADCILEQLIPLDASDEQLCAAHPAVTLALLKRRRAGGALSSAAASLTKVIETQQATTEDWREPLLMLAKWTEEDTGDLEKALQWVSCASKLPGSDTALSTWRQLATLHFQLSKSGPHRGTHIVAAIEAFAKALSDFETLYVTQNALRLMSLWFTYGSQRDVSETVNKGLHAIPLATWLRVIPQLFARIGIPVEDTRRQLTALLAAIARAYPHAVIFPLIVAERSGTAARRKTCLRLMDELNGDTTIRALIAETASFSTELVRVAILWTEKWLQAIHDAAKKHENLDHVCGLLNPLFDELESAATPHEKAFDVEFGVALRRAKEALATQQSERAWVILKKVYTQLNTYVKGMRTIEVNDVSPTLASLVQARMIIPGSFSLDAEPIFIAKVDPSISVISSKQKPRRFGLVGSDGITWRFLLKGHEDLRQDERVMQVLDLVNSIFGEDDTTRAHRLSIPTYNVTPLSANVGILQWVEGTQTIYKLIEGRRNDYNQSIMDECNMICTKGGLRRIDEYHQMPKNVRKSLLSHVFTNTSDEELKLICWDLNRSSETWIEYRRHYSNSLSVMSMVGYVIGLGDRHLNNIMIHRKGAIVHIDFGDCFEVAMHRASFAEAVPFRLTRLLARALGVGGAAGAFNQTSRHVMQLIRVHRDSLQSLLEAFLYDPLINWHQNDPESPPPARAQDIDEPTLPEAALEAERSMWRELLHFIQDNIPVDLETVPVEEIEPHATLEDIVLLVRKKIESKELAAAVALVQYAKSKFPQVLTAEPKSVDSQLLQSVCLQQSITERRNKDANAALTRVRAKLDGCDFGPTALAVEEQVARLVQEATSIDNLAEAYITGWAPFW